MGTTNYRMTFIQVAEDCPVDAAQQPPVGAKGPSVAAYSLINEHPYELTSDDVLFEVNAIRKEIAERDRAAAREAFFAKSQACLRSSPLTKRYGWGIHHDAEGRVALVALGSEEYERLASDPDVKQLRAMRSRRA
ncbi:MAG: DUF6157 family protein [Acidipropionibacterium acidipropionici]|jgi:hypothetical protein|uniref:DUF6157 family protein n=1 Tax=Acidipropionibacterium acidipropionici TaxID=1748 RepID=UPI00041CA538|nr:DUF6157 family protein [Acidipropionibacterium acidipropionici]ALN15593.1 hypothetical protein ASQ49_10285 [Acidipropionibacterium acidipropionici]APZ08660.1 hypothetical protein BWX38_04620 [Acidipropionibacterium acidipropionici]